MAKPMKRRVIDENHPNWSQHPSNPEHVHKWTERTLPHSKKTHRTCGCGASAKTGELKA